MTTPPSPFLDPDTAAIVAAALHTDGSSSSWDPDPHAHREHGYPLGRQQCELLYLLVRATGARRIVEFATSIGISTLYLAAAVRDNGGGLVIGSEIVPEKARTAEQQLAAAGLDGFVELRVGDARATLADVGGPIDLLLLDGWPTGRLPSVDREVLELLVPSFRPGTVVMDDNGEADVLAILRDPQRGFRSLSLPLPDGTYELAVYSP